jgi:hypothetical protein
MINLSLSWSIFKDGATDNYPVRYDRDWLTFTKLLSVPIPVQSHLSEPKLATPAFSIATFLPDRPRSISSVASIQLLAFDFDNKHLEDKVVQGLEVAELLDGLGVASFIYTTYSSTSEKERFRVVIPLERSVHSRHLKEDWFQLSEWALDRLGFTPYRAMEGCLDLGSLHNPAGIHFLPSSPRREQMRFWDVDGKPLAVPLDEIRVFQPPVEIGRSSGYTCHGTPDFAWTERFGIDFTTLRLRQLLEDHGIKTSHASPVEGGYKFRCQCPWGEEHSQVKNGMDAYIQLRQGRFPTFHCSHACHCDSHTIRAVAELFGPEVLRRYAEPASRRFIPGPLLKADGLI